jgi:hypothetical protein
MGCLQIAGHNAARPREIPLGRFYALMEFIITNFPFFLGDFIVMRLQSMVRG